MLSWRTDHHCVTDNTDGKSRYSNWFGEVLVEAVAGSKLSLLDKLEMQFL